MQFSPYLNFDGNCAEAFAFYKDVFNGTVVHQSTFGEMPQPAAKPESDPMRPRPRRAALGPVPGFGEKWLRTEPLRGPPKFRTSPPTFGCASPCQPNGFKRLRSGKG